MDLVLLTNGTWSDFNIDIDIGRSQGTGRVAEPRRPPCRGAAQPFAKCSINVYDIYRYSKYFIIIIVINKNINNNIYLVYLLVLF